jgi:hypothetical protein
MAKTVTAQEVYDLHDEVMDDLIDVTNTTIWHEWAKLPRNELNHRQRTIVGLLSDINDFPACELGTHLFRCQYNDPCRSVLCPHCRQTAQNAMSRRLLQCFDTTPRSDLRFLTLLCDLSYDPRRELPAKREKLKRKLDTTLRGLPAKPRVYGAYEIDVKHPTYARSDRSREVLGELGMSFVGQKQNSYLLHLHAVVDLNGVNNDTLKKRLKDRFPGRWRVRCTNLWSSRTVQENLYVLGQYMTKTRLQYSDNLYGSSASGKARYMDFYPDHVIRELAHTIKLMYGVNHYAKFSFNA